MGSLTFAFDLAAPLEGSWLWPVALLNCYQTDALAMALAFSWFHETRGTWTEHTKTSFSHGSANKVLSVLTLNPFWHKFLIPCQDLPRTKEERLRTALSAPLSSPRRPKAGRSFCFRHLFPEGHQSQTTHGAFSGCLFQPRSPPSQQTPNDSAAGDVQGEALISYSRIYFWSF